MNEQPACLLCGNPNRNEIRTALVAWKEPHDEPFASIPRCSDVQAINLVNRGLWAASQRRNR